MGERVTLLHRARVGNLRNVATQLVVLRWANVDISDPNSVRRFAAQGTAIVSHAQRQAVSAAQDFLAAFLAAELDIAPPNIDVAAEALIGHTLAGRELGEVMTRAAIYARVQRTLGASLGRARAAGANLLIRRVRTELVETSRSALLQGMTASRHVDRYEVVTATGRCPLCAGIAAQGPRATDTRPHFHDHCRCSLRPAL